MEANKYQQEAWSFVEGNSGTVGYMLNGLMEETGEVSGKFAKAIRKGVIKIDDNDIVLNPGANMDDRREFMMQLKKELGDVQWMVSGLAHVLGWSLSDIMEHNIEKLSGRAKRGTIIGEGDDR